MPGNAPDNVTDRMIDKAGGACKQPSDEQIHKHACENWRDLMNMVGDAAFESAEVDGCYDKSTEKTDVLITLRTQIPWVDVEI